MPECREKCDLLPYTFNFFIITFYRVVVEFLYLLQSESMDLLFCVLKNRTFSCQSTSHNDPSHAEGQISKNDDLPKKVLEMTRFFYYP